MSQRCQLEEEAPGASEDRYALVARATNDGVWDWNLETNKVYFSIQWKAMLGLEDGAVGDSPEEWFNRVLLDDIERVKEQVTLHLEGAISRLEAEYRILHKDGNYRWVLNRGIAIRNAEGKAIRMVGSQMDITDRRMAVRRWQHDALHDELTGLPNRALFLNHLGLSISHGAPVTVIPFRDRRTKRPGDHSFAVLFLDVDGFKLINDSLGHAAGDELLIAVARRLQACVRTGGTVARLGGDEFGILLDGIQDIAEATCVAKRIQERLAAPFRLSSHEVEVFVTASIGIALGGTEERPEDVLNNADTAMYHAKARGKGCYASFVTDRARLSASIAQLCRLTTSITP